MKYHTKRTDLLFINKVNDKQVRIKIFIDNVTEKPCV